MAIVLLQIIHLPVQAQSSKLLVWLAREETVEVVYTLPKGFDFSCLFLKNPTRTDPIFCSPRGVTGIIFTTINPSDANFIINERSRFYVDAYRGGQITGLTGLVKPVKPFRLYFPRVG